MIFAQVTDPDKAASLASAQASIEVLFDKWEIAPSLTGLRAVIHSVIDQTDVSDDNDLTALKNQMFALSHWGDALPS